ncbi:MAG: hypothetical protein ACU85U_10200 [Gammaproteobacteria bacterium]|jgi:hypothetical protein
MTSFLCIGSALGATLGLLHGFCLYRAIATRAAVTGSPGLNVRGLYYAVWTLILWTAFGSYVLALWLLGIIANTLVHLRRTPDAG